MKLLIYSMNRYGNKGFCGVTARGLLSMLSACMCYTYRWDGNVIACTGWRKLPVDYCSVG